MHEKREKEKETTFISGGYGKKRKEKITPNQNRGTYSRKSTDNETESSCMGTDP